MKLLSFLSRSSHDRFSPAGDHSTNRHSHRAKQSPFAQSAFAQSASLLSAAVACASLTIAGAGLVSASSPHPVTVAPIAAGLNKTTASGTIVSKSTTMTPPQAARFRARMNKIPRLSRLSTRAQVKAFVAYFAAKGFHPTAYAAKYSPSGRIQTLEYHASRRSHFSNKVDVSISPHKSLTAISMT